MTIAATDDFRCAPWTAAADPDPIGTAPRFDDLVLVEVPLPWPSDVAEVPELAVPADAAPACRVMAVVPEPDRAGGERLVTWYRREGARCRYVGRELVVAPDEVGDVVAALSRGDELAGSAAPPELLLCSHGSRDRCCGSRGTRLHLEALGRWPGVRTRRSSHLSGHRFAPTGMTLPDGHLWAYLDVEVLDTVLAGRGPVADVLRHERGTPALDAPFQVLERAALERFGWHVLAWPVLEAEVLDGRHVLRFGTPDGVVSVAATVSVRRELPVLVCGSGPDSAVKTAPEYVGTDVSVTQFPI